MQKLQQKKVKEWDKQLEEGTVVREAQGGRQHVESYIALTFLQVLNHLRKPQRDSSLNEKSGDYEKQGSRVVAIL